MTSNTALQSEIATRYNGTIHSRVMDNWDRVVATFNIVHGIYKRTAHIEDRTVFYKNGVMDYAAMMNLREETIMIEMLLVWIAITIESAINHALVEQFKCDNKKNIIEEIKNDIDGNKFKNKNKQFVSELIEISNPSEITIRLVVIVNRHKKIESSGEDRKNLLNIVNITERLAKIRNEIVHDKPIGQQFLYDENGDYLDVNINLFSKYDQQKESNYNHLKQIFMEYDEVIQFLTNQSESDFHFINFQSLLKNN